VAQRYDLVRRELAETTRLNEALGAPSARAMDKLFAAINTTEACAAASASAPQSNAVSGVRARQSS